MISHLRNSAAVLVLLSATSLAMAAAGNNQPSQASRNQPPQAAQTAGANADNTQPNGNPVAKLNSDQIRQIQQDLKKDGFDAGRVDGVLGRETEAALRNFQKSKGLQQSGQPDNETLSALGMNGSPMQNVGQASSPPPSGGTSH